MIEYLKERFGLETTPLRLLRALSQSKDLEDFLKRLDMPEDRRHKFIEQHTSRAEEDYRKFVEQYVRGTNVEG